MALNTRAIALQGIGFGPAQVARHGLLPVYAKPAATIFSVADYDAAEVSVLSATRVDQQNRAILAFVMSVVTKGLIS